MAAFQTSVFQPMSLVPQSFHRLLGQLAASSFLSSASQTTLLSPSLVSLYYPL